MLGLGSDLEVRRYFELCDKGRIFWDLAHLSTSVLDLSNFCLFRHPEC